MCMWEKSSGMFSKSLIHSWVATWLALGWPSPFSGLSHLHPICEGHSLHEFWDLSSGSHAAHLPSSTSIFNQHVCWFRLMYTHTHKNRCACVCMSMWKLEGAFRCHSSGMLSTVFWGRVSHRPKAWKLSWTVWPTSCRDSSPRNSSVSASPLGLAHLPACLPSIQILLQAFSWLTHLSSLHIAHFLSKKIGTIRDYFDNTCKNHSNYLITRCKSIFFQSWKKLIVLTRLK